MAVLSTLRHWEQPSRLWTKVQEMFNSLFASDGAALLMSNFGAPDDPAKATANVNPAGDDNGLTFTAVDFGTAGNDITITYVDPEADDAELAVTVEGSAISVSLATDGDGLITTTAAEVLAEVEATPEADALVVVTIYAGDTGALDDGSGVVTALAAVPLAGGLDGSGAGEIAPGGLLIDTDNGTVYRNSGTTELPEWTALADAA